MNFELTERQKETLDFINNYINNYGYSPSLNDVAKGIYASKPVAKKHLDALEIKGFIKHTPHIARSIVINKIS